MIHQKQCITKRNKVQMHMEPDTRTPPPKPPWLAVPDPKASVAEVEAYNIEAQAAYEASMPTCGKCGRSFETNEKLLAHATSCRACPKEPFVRPGEQGTLEP